MCIIYKHVHIYIYIHTYILTVILRVIVITAGAPHVHAHEVAERAAAQRRRPDLHGEEAGHQGEPFV